ncbi:MAG: TIGR01777 family oxidoreductase [Anaerolineales bacterium]
MRVLISGGTGMIGRELAASLQADGHSVWVLTRSPSSARVPPGAQALGWDGRTTKGWGTFINQTDAVVNLVGERLAGWPWTPARKARFWTSRVEGGRAISEAIRLASHRPQVLVQASGVNYYGPHGLAPVSETDAAGDDELARLCLAWEDSTHSVEALGVRRAIVRSAIVLSAVDGILPIMMLPVRLYMGGPLAGGHQGLPWIHIKDEVAALRFLLENEQGRGPFNLTAPQPVSSGDFLRTLAKVLRRPYWFPVPAFALRLVLGGMSALVLTGEYLQPRRLLELGFRFKFENVEDALWDLLTPGLAL